METQAVVVLVTTPSEAVAKQIARKLLEQKLSACVNILPPVVSIYTWQGELHEDSEILMIIKTRSDLVEDRLISAIRALHPYEVPEIIAVPVTQGFEYYLDWIQKVTL